MTKQFDSVIIVLGSPNDDTGKLLANAKARCEKAYETYQQLSVRGSCAVLPTGGFGEHFNRTNTAHADYTKQYMIDLGISEDVFLEAALSRHSIEDAVFSNRILQQYKVQKCFVVTSDFHADRVKFIFEYVYDKAQELVVVPAMVILPEKEKARLIAHEKQALAGLKKNGIIYEGL